MIPEINNAPIGSLVRIPYKIKITLGGIKMPSVPPAATLEVDNPGLYLYFFISGKAIFATVAVVAFREPEIDEKIAAVPIVAIARPPCKCPIQLSTILYKSFPIPVYDKIIPIKINNGITLSE